MNLARFTIVILAILAVATLVQTALAQTTDQVIITWEANNFYPANFLGKPLVTPGTPVTALVEVVRGGKFLNISGSNIAWYLDDNFVSEGHGKKSVTFTARQKDSGTHTIRAEIERAEGTLVTSLQIPITAPRVVIEAPYPNGIVQAQSDIFLKSIPYFFTNSSLNDLIFFWQINDTRQQSTGDNALSLKLGALQTSGQQTLRITGTVQNQSNLAEFANGRAKLMVQ
ncbi:MAG: hypothetical protein Q7R98_01565 [Candidatus Jorgensenbacteria bacterium]|nr:hypothetical protein [Candidatus Jorgensenbacteria bacterium]